MQSSLGHRPNANLEILIGFICGSGASPCFTQPNKICASMSQVARFSFCGYKSTEGNKRRRREKRRRRRGREDREGRRGTAVAAEYGSHF